MRRTARLDRRAAGAIAAAGAVAALGIGAAAPNDRTVPDKPPAAERAAQARGDVVVSSDDGRCPALRRIDDERFAGGCRIKAKSPRIDMTVSTVGGEMPFAHCGMSFTLRVDGSGRTALTDFLLVGESPCNDTYPCWDDNTVHPWHGQIVRRPSGELVHEVDGCIHNCLGKFEGPLELALQESSRGASGATAAKAALGVSGFAFDGEWTLAGEPIAVTARTR
jgi:hypothetical protein